MMLLPSNRYKERSEIEALYFTINTLLKALNQPNLDNLNHAFDTAANELGIPRSEFCKL